MARITPCFDEEMREYMLRVSSREPSVLRELRELASSMESGGMQVSQEQGQFIHFLVRTLEAVRVLEIGTYTGYSSIWAALALPGDGELITCDVNRRWTDIAAEFWRKAGVEDRIHLKLAPAVETLRSLIGSEKLFDFIFIDGDKGSYPTYYELCLKLLRPGGTMMIDNVFMGGRVKDRDSTNPGVKALQDLNRLILSDRRVDISMLPVSDGITLVRKR